MKCCLPGGNGVFSSQQLFELFALASETIESLLGVIFLYVWAEEEEEAGVGGGGLARECSWSAGSEGVFGRRGFKVLAAASSVAQTDDINDG